MTREQKIILIAGPNGARRFKAGLDNFRRIYRPLVDGWVLYDNSGAQPVLLDGVQTK
jgi:predicted ABC-type ATPase